MCGIVGLISKQTQGFYGSHVDIFTDMLIMDQVRGMDGTGVFGVYKNKQAYLTKVGTHASNLVQLKAYDQFKTKMARSMTMVFGHNRKATVGNVSSTNSHPFMEENVILIHNGFISNAREFDTAAPVDSQALARGFNKAKAPLDVLRKVTGAYALVWYDKRDKTLRIARNSERPLFMAETDNFIAIASEPWMILGALSKARRNTDVKIHDVMEVKTHVLYEFTGTGEVKTTPYFPVANYGNNRWQGFCEGYEEYGGAVDCSGTAHRTPVVERPVHAPVPTTPVHTGHPGLLEVWNDLMSTLPIAGEELAFQVKRVYQATVGGKGTLSVNGMLTINGHEIDVTGLIDWTNNMIEVNQCMMRDGQHQNWLHGEVVARGVTTSGPWIRVNNIFSPSMITTWNKNDVPQFLWDRIVKSHKCCKCSAPIVSKEAGFTSVKLNNSGDITKVVCAKCVMQGLERDDNESSQTSSDSSVQTGQPVSEVTVH